MVALWLAPTVVLACWQNAGERYSVSPQLLHAIARVESGLDPRAVNHSHRQRTGTYDIGLMQINSSHLQRLAKYGIEEQHLFDPCTNIHVGAWLLADQFSRHGVSWEGVGAYNAACTQLRGKDCQAARVKYAWRVYRQLTGAAARTAATGNAMHAPRPERGHVSIAAVRVSP